MELTPEVFDRYLDYVETSKTYGRICTELYGIDLRQYSMLTGNQMRLLLDRFDLLPGMKVLDLGCGTGRIAEYLSQKTGAHFLATDFAPKIIERAQARNQGNEALINFRVLDMNAFDLQDATFDRILCIDTLYFLNNLTTFIKHIQSLAMPQAKWAVFYSSGPKRNGGNQGLPTGETQFSLALKEANLRFETVELTEDDRDYWTRSLEITKKFEQALIGEGYEEFVQSRLTEIGEILEFHRLKMMRRYFYLIDF